MHRPLLCAHHLLAFASIAGSYMPVSKNTFATLLTTPPTPPAPPPPNYTPRPNPSSNYTTPTLPYLPTPRVQTPPSHLPFLTALRPNNSHPITFISPSLYTIPSLPSKNGTYDHPLGETTLRPRKNKDRVCPAARASRQTNFDIGARVLVTNLNSASAKGLRKEDFFFEADVAEILPQLIAKVTDES